MKILYDRFLSAYGHILILKTNNTFHVQDKKYKTNNIFRVQNKKYKTNNICRLFKDKKYKLLEQMLLQNVGYQFYWNMFTDTQRTLAIRKYYTISLCLEMDICLKFCVCIWITWNNFNQMFKSFNDCLFVLKIVECLKIVFFCTHETVESQITLLKANGVYSIQYKFA